jgi:hypothetical protein
MERGREEVLVVALTALDRTFQMGIEEVQMVDVGTTRQEVEVSCQERQDNGVWRAEGNDFAWRMQRGLQVEN